MSDDCNKKRKLFSGAVEDIKNLTRIPKTPRELTGNMFINEFRFLRNPNTKLS